MLAMTFLFVGISNYILYMQTGKLPFDIGNLKAPSLASLNPANLNPLRSDKATVYKWVDENGVTQFSTEPPPNQDQNTEVLELDAKDMNTMQAVEIPDRDSNSSATALNNLPTNPLQVPGAVKQLVDDAKNVQNLMDERYKNLEDATH